MSTDCFTNVGGAASCGSRMRNFSCRRPAAAQDLAVYNEPIRSTSRANEVIVQAQCAQPIGAPVRMSTFARSACGRPRSFAPCAANAYCGRASAILRVSLPQTGFSIRGWR